MQGQRFSSNSFLNRLPFDGAPDGRINAVGCMIFTAQRV